MHLPLNVLRLSILLVSLLLNSYFFVPSIFYLINFFPFFFCVFAYPYFFFPYYCIWMGESYKWSTLCSRFRFVLFKYWIISDGYDGWFLKFKTKSNQVKEYVNFCYTSIQFGFLFGLIFLIFWNTSICNDNIHYVFLTFSTKSP